MELPTLPFTITDWDKVEPVTYPGETGEAVWRTFNMGEIRVRVVDYSPGYLADHWCYKGHILYVLEGELTSELKDGRQVVITPGISYQVSDFGDSPHRSKTDVGAKLFIVDKYRPSIRTRKSPGQRPGLFLFVGDVLNLVNVRPDSPLQRIKHSC